MSSSWRQDVWVGRGAELESFGSAVDVLAEGRGCMVWVEGEPGIGKSSLVRRGMSVAQGRGYEVLSATADQFSQRLPLRVTLDCLGVRRQSRDPRRARIAQLMRDRGPGVSAVDDIVSSTAELLVALVSELCTESPTAIILDDMQWADDASLLVWHRMALMVDQLPLLLVGVCREGSRRDQVRELRAAVRRRGRVISLQPLGHSDVIALVTGLNGAPPSPRLANLAAQAMGNPLYLGELIGAFAREGDGEVEQLGRDPSAEQLDRVPASFAAALDDQLNLIPEGTADILKTAVVLGGEFAVNDLAVLLRRPVCELAAGLQDAMAAGIIVGVGSRLAFRHPLIQRALYESMPGALRQALHHEAAQALAAAGADQLRVAQQLLLAAQPGDGWTRSWLAEAAPTLAAAAPDVAAELLQRVLDHARPDDGNRDSLAISLAQTLLGMGRHEEAAARAQQALTSGVRSGRRPEMYWVLARAQFCLGENEAAGDSVERALVQPDLTDRWRARLLGTLAMFQRAGGGAGDLDAADAAARRALASAEKAEDSFAAAYALIDLSLNHSVRRDHATALQCIDRALGVLGEGPDYADLRAFAFNGRISTMQKLDRWSDAEETLRHAQRRTQRLHHPGPAASNLTAAVLFYWLGRWDEALAELITAHDTRDGACSGLREHRPNLLRHGIAALIAGRRDEPQIAEEHLHKGRAAPILTMGDRENQDFLLAARALAFEQSGDLPAAVDALSPILTRRPGEMALTHQWLPCLTRLAIAAGDNTTARAAMRTCRAEAEAATTPARAAVAALRCEGLLAGDPALLRRAVTHYRTIGPLAELGSALEDLAAVLADNGATEDAKKALNEAIGLYGDVGAKWDTRRAVHRLRGHGVRQGIRGPRPKRATYGWEALTPTELTIAGLVAEGLSTPAIAQVQFLSRRTVQTHISHIMTKLNLRSRVDIAREVLQRRANA